MDNKHRSQLEINDLIGDAVNNAVARRSQIDSELSALSDEQARSITGGGIIEVPKLAFPFPPIVAGMIIPHDIPVTKITKIIST